MEEATTYIESISRLTYSDPTLTCISLHSKKIGNDKLTTLSIYLGHNNTVQYSYLRDNNISTIGILSLSTCLLKNKTLLVLDLSNNAIGDYGASSLANALQFNKSLSYLDLSYNRIGDHGISSFQKCLVTNKSLTELSFHHNQISGVQSLSHALKINKTLLDLNLSHNQIHNQELIYLAKSLCINHKLQYLELQGNPISYEGELNLLEAVYHNTSLTCLKLVECENDSDIQEEIQWILNGNQNLKDYTLKNKALRKYNYREYIVGVLMILNQLPICHDLHWGIVNMLRIKDIEVW